MNLMHIAGPVIGTKFEPAPPPPLPPPQAPRSPHFPPHNAPRVWFITNGASPISIHLARELLAHGDYIVIAVSPAEVENEEARKQDFEDFLQEIRTQGTKEKGGRRASGQALSEHGSEASSAVDVGVLDVAEGEKQPGGDGASTAEKSNDNETGARRVKMKPWRERIRVVPLDPSSVSQAQSAVAEAKAAFGMDIDIMLLTTPSTVLGTVEELAQDLATQALVRDQFELNFFSNVNLIKTILPSMRERKNGHIILLSGTTGHFGTPGLSTHCASIWAIEGYCDSLAYEIAPFNIKTTIVQPNIEVGTLTNKLTSAPPMAEYSPEQNDAPFQREIIASLLDRLEGAAPLDDLPALERRRSSTAASVTPIAGIESSPVDPDAMDALSSTGGLTTGDLLSSPGITSLYPPLASEMQYSLVAETVFALAAIGGHDNPPARHIVGHEGIVAVKEKLKTVSEELEEFLEASAAVDFAKPDNDTLV